MCFPPLCCNSFFILFFDKLPCVATTAEIVNNRDV